MPTGCPESLEKLQISGAPSEKPMGPSMETRLTYRLRKLDKRIEEDRREEKRREEKSREENKGEENKGEEKRTKEKRRE